MIDRNFFISPYGSQTKYLNFKLLNWHKEITVYLYEKYGFEESSLNLLFKELLNHIDKYTCLKFDIRTLPIDISFLNILLPKVKTYKIESISISWENLKQFNFNDQIQIKSLDLYLHNPTEDEILKLLNTLTPVTFVNIRCYRNGSINKLGYFTTSNLMNDLQLKMIDELQKKNVPYKSYNYG
jgi:hypothetical protein